MCPHTFNAAGESFNQFQFHQFHEVNDKIYCGKSWWHYNTTVTSTTTTASTANTPSLLYPTATTLSSLSLRTSCPCWWCCGRTSASAMSSGGVRALGSWQRDRPPAYAQREGWVAEGREIGRGEVQNNDQEAGRLAGGRGVSVTIHRAGNEKEG